MFPADAIVDGRAMKTLNDLGGPSGLKDKLIVKEDYGLNTSLQNDLKARKAAFGTNEPIEPETTSIWALTIEALNDETLKILIVAAIASLIIGIGTEGLAKGWYEGVAIFTAVIIISGVTVGNNYIKEQQFQELFKKSQKKFCDVMRDGKQCEVDQYDLLTGDLLRVTAGLILPVDCLLLKCYGNLFRLKLILGRLLCDESATTGESRDIPKCPAYGTDGSPFLISGAQIKEGDGWALVCCIGVSSRTGILQKSLRMDEEPTPLQKRLEFLGNQIGKVGLSGATLAFVACF